MENHNTKIIQWNCNGIRGKMEEIKMLLSKYNPSILCIQETRLLQSLVVNFNNYSVFRYDHTGGETASQGLITLVKKCHYVNRINIQSTLQAIAIQIKHPIYNFLTICNIYIHPSHRLQQTEISNLIEQLPTPFLLIGDFNAHNPIWGSINRCNKGKIIENILYQTEQICCLNNGSPTHLSTQGTLTCIDISLCSASIYQDTTWQVLDPQSADHFPILISTKNFNPTTVTDDNHGNSIDPSNLLWSYKKADWTKFRETIEWDHSQTDDINTSITQFNQAILTAAKEAIPTVQLNQLKKFVPWWCKEVKDALKDRNRAYRLFKQHPSTTNLIDFKKKRAIARNTIHNKKKESWHNFMSTISTTKNPRLLWVKVDRTFSSPKHHENGISQGSPLSCTLFNIAVSDISSCIPEGVSHGLYVDDLFLVARNHDILHVQIILQDALNNLGTWSEQNGLRFSPEKSSCINFKRGRKLQNDPPLSLYGQLIEYKTSHKLLGITLDTEFSFKIHLENIKSKAHKALNCIKILNGKRYGVNRNILARIYKATIRPILDYGSTIYDGAKESDLNKLEVIQNSALRIISGALRTSPVISLRADNGIPPLSLRRKILIGNYICRILQNPKNPGYEATIQHPPQSNINFNRKHKPTSTRFKQYFTDANINLTNTAYMKQSIPPWTITLPETQLLLKEKKSNISPNEIKSKFNQLLNKVNCKETFYCDGSKSPQHCGSAFVHEGNTISFKLPNISSSYTAEIIALQKCIQFITQNKYSNPTIFTDSKSLILAIKQRNTSNPLIKNIQEVLHQSKLTGTTTNIVWIPGHSGIAGNELADAGAKNINAQSQCQTICAQDLKNVFKNICASNWTREWQQTDKQLRKIKPETQYWPTSSRQKRIEEVIIARLRIGHTRVSHSYLIDKKPRPICDTCHTPLSVAHILIECTKFQVERQKLLPHPLTLENLLGNNKETIDSTLKYLYKTKLFGTL
ncbi:hypothetical protein M8J76_012853 [Diaphorina citri]|nr:hypothetical protein M8J76_012853 [Diaphorina citri]